MSVNVGSATGYLDLDISGFLAGLRSAQDEANKQSKNIATTIGNNLSSVGSKLTSVGTTLTTGVTLPIAGAGAAIVTLSSNFETAMSKVSAISGATGSDLDRLNAKAQEMGATTKFSATEAADAFTYMAMAGWKTEDMLQGIEGIMSLAAADGLDLATTSDIVTDALTAFGLSAADSGHFADVLAKASSSANTNVSMLGESFKYVAPVAGSLGYTAEDTAIALGLMANAGIKGSQSGTALRGALTKLIKPTEDAALLMEQYGLSMTNSDGSMKTLSEVMVMLRENMGELTEAEQAQVAATLFGQEAMSGMLAIINASDSDFQNLTDQINNADGAAQQMADTMMDNLAGQTTILKSSLEGLALQFGEIILPYVKQFVAWVQELVTKFQALSPEQKEQIVKWAAIAAAAGPALVVFGKLISGAGSLITTFGKIPGAISSVAGGLAKITGVATSASSATTATAGLGAAFKTLGAVFSKIAWPIAIIVAVISAITTLWKTNEDFRNSIIAIWEQLKATFEKLTSGIVEKVNSLGFDFENIGELIKAIWEGLCNFLAPIFEGAFQAIADTFDFIVNEILNTFDFFIALFSGDWEGVWEAIKTHFVNIWNFIADFFVNIGNILVGLLDEVCGWFGTTWEDTWNSIKQFFVDIWNSIVDFFVGLWDGIVGAVQGAWNWIMDILSTVGNWIYDNVIAPVANFFTGLWNSIVDTFHMVIDPWIEIVRRLSVIFYEDVIQPVAQFFVDLWNDITSGLQAAWDWVVSILSTVANWVNTNVIQPVVKFFTGLWNTISNAASACWNAIVSVWKTVSTWYNDKIIKPVANFFKGMWDGLKNGAKNAWEGIKSIFSSVATFFGNIFKTAWEKVKAVFSTGGKVFDGIKDGIVSVFKTVVNALIKGINFVVAKPFEGLNSILDTIYGLEIVGVQPFSWLTWRAPIPQIPYLAKGAVLRPNNPFLAVVGDQKSGTNIEAPLATIEEAVANVIRSFAYNIIGLQKESLRFLSNIDSELAYVVHNVLAKPVNAYEGERRGFAGDVRNGDTFIFNSPKAIDEVEAARQMRKAKRDLAEGF